MPGTAHYRRAYKNAIGKKGAHEASLLFEESDEVVAPLNSKDEVIVPSKSLDLSMSPASSMASFYMPEIKPITLPGAWVVVGKGGKAIKQAKMYEPPQPKKKKKKKKKAKEPLVVGGQNEFLEALEDLPSSSNCVQDFDRALAQRTKAIVKGLDAKHWRTYREIKELKREARDALLAAMDTKDGSLPVAAVEMPAEVPRRSNKANSHAEKTRRSSRRAAASARCYSLDDGGAWDSAPIASEAPPRTTIQDTSGRAAHPKAAKDTGSCSMANIDKRKAVDAAEQPNAKMFKDESKTVKQGKAPSSCTVM